MSRKKRRGAVNHNSKRRRKLLLEIAERDNWICQLCGEPVKKERVPNDPDAPSLDHRESHCNGGSNKRDNLQLAHKRCNDSHLGKPDE